MRDQPTAPARAAYWHIALHPLLHAADPSFPPIIPINPITLDYSSLLCGWGSLRPFLLKKKTASMVAVTMEAACQKGGGYLLSRFRSIIGVVRFNFSVRNGKRWNPHANTT